HHFDRSKKLASQPMNVDLLILHAAQLVTCAGPGPKRGAALLDPGVVADGALAVEGGRIVAAGPTADLAPRFRAAWTIDATGRSVCPGFVDAHTHVVY